MSNAMFIENNFEGQCSFWNHPSLKRKRTTKLKEKKYDSRIQTYDDSKEYLDDSSSIKESEKNSVCVVNHVYELP